MYKNVNSDKTVTIEKYEQVKAERDQYRAMAIELEEIVKSLPRGELQ